MSVKSIDLETTRLWLKGLRPTYIQYIFENFSKEKIMEELGHNTEAEYEREAFKFKNGYTAYNRSFIIFLLIEKSSKKIIGRCSLHNWNKEHNRAELGYHLLLEQSKGQGYMTEAVDEVMSYGFNILGLHRIEALVGRQNQASLRIVKKQNFIQEGILRQHYYQEGKYEDSIIFSVLQCDYLMNLKKENKLT